MVVANLSKDTRMKKIIFPIVLLLALTGCQSKEDQRKHDEMVAQQARAQLLAELKAKEEARKKAALEAQRNASKLEQAGIRVEGSKIIIDTNKTKGFFKAIAQALQKKVTKLQEDLQKGKLEEQDAGVKIDENSINIDLNKTKGFLEVWGKKMQEVVKGLDEVSKKIEPLLAPEHTSKPVVPSK